MTTERDIRRDLKIDEYDLEREWLEQSTIFHHWAMEYVDAVFDRDEAKEKLEIARSRKAQEIRNSGDKKPGEAAIMDMLRGDKELIKLGNDLAQATYHVNQLAAVKEGLHHKKMALEMITKTRLADWTSEPKVPTPTRRQQADDQSRREREALKGGRVRRPSKMTSIK